MNLNYYVFEKMPIFDLLKIEEALLRTNDESWCLINIGTRKSIVMGLSSNPNDLLQIDAVTKDNIPVIQRFSGGGTVIVDESTLFVSFIFKREDHPIDPYPKPILEWTANFYQKALGLPSFTLKENDYAIGNKKVGGNAQYLRQTRWLHHTSFLHDYLPENMLYLKNPKRQPAYREGREHTDFLTTLKPHVTKEAFVEGVLKGLDESFTLTQKRPPEAFPDHRQSTKIVTRLCSI